MSQTKRAQNKCKKCGYTWYPRGKKVSLKCPSCGSSEVGFAGTGVALGALLLVVIAIFGGNKKSTSTVPVETNPAISASSVISNDAVAPDRQASSANAAEHVVSAVNNQSPYTSSPVGSDISTDLDADERSEGPCKNEVGSAECQNDDMCRQSSAIEAKCMRKNTVRNDLF